MVAFVVLLVDENMDVTKTMLIGAGDAGGCGSAGNDRVDEQLSWRTVVGGLMIAGGIGLIVVRAVTAAGVSGGALTFVRADLLS